MSVALPETIGKPCKNGHTIGRYKNGKCIACHRANVIASRKPGTQPWFRKRVSAEPVRRQLRFMFDYDELEFMQVAALRRNYAKRFDLDPRQVERDLRQVFRSDTITIALADRFATFMGLHLDLLFDPADLQVDEETSA